MELPENTIWLGKIRSTLYLETVENIVQSIRCKHVDLLSCGGIFGQTKFSENAPRKKSVRNIGVHWFHLPHWGCLLVKYWNQVSIHKKNFKKTAIRWILRIWSKKLFFSYICYILGGQGRGGSWHRPPPPPQNMTYIYIYIYKYVKNMKIIQNLQYWSNAFIFVAFVAYLGHILLQVMCRILACFLYLSTLNTTKLTRWNIYEIHTNTCASSLSQSLCIRSLFTMVHDVLTICFQVSPAIARVSKIRLESFCSRLWAESWSGSLPLESGRRDIEFASVFAPVASLVVSFVSEHIVETCRENEKVRPSNGGYLTLWCTYNKRFCSRGIYFTNSAYGRHYKYLR